MPESQPKGLAYQPETEFALEGVDYALGKGTAWMALTFEAVIHPLRKVRETRGQDVFESVSSVSFLMFWLTPQVFIEPRTERWHGARPNCA